MPSETIAVDMTASARMPGTKKLAGVAVGVETTETFEKKSRKMTGMPRVRSRARPGASVMWTSAPVWAARGRKASAVVLTGTASWMARPVWVVCKSVPSAGTGSAAADPTVSK